MAISTSTPTEPRAWSIGPKKIQLVDFRALTGATSGTVTASNLARIDHIMMLVGRLRHSAAPTVSGNVATLAFTVPAETAATLTQSNIVYTAVANLGKEGNDITVTLVDGTGDDTPVVDGAEVVTVSGSAITIRIDPTAVTGSTKQHVVDALTASADASALISAAVASGHESDVCPTHTVSSLAGGVSGGARGTALCIGT